MDMDSDDEIAVARPSKMSSGYSTDSDAIASVTASMNEKEGSNQVSEQKLASGSRQEAAAAAAGVTVIDLMGSSSSPSPASDLSDVDDEVLEVPPPTKVGKAVLNKVQSEQHPPVSCVEKDSDSEQVTAIASSPPPQPLQTAASRKPKRKTNVVGMYTLEEPPKKRRRGRGSKTAVPRDSIAPDETGADTTDELGLHGVIDRLDRRPTRKALMSGGTRPRISARSRRQYTADDGVPTSARLRKMAFEREEYIPLHLRAGSSEYLLIKGRRILVAYILRRLGPLRSHQVLPVDIS